MTQGCDRVKLTKCDRGRREWNEKCLYVSDRSSHPEVFLVKGVAKIFSKFTGKHSCRSVISIKLQGNFIEMTLRQGCSPINLLHIFRTPLTKNRLFLKRNSILSYEKLFPLRVINSKIFIEILLSSN